MFTLIIQTVTLFILPIVGLVSAFALSLLQLGV